MALADKTLADHSLLSIDDIGVTQALSFFNDFTGYYEHPAIAQPALSLFGPARRRQRGDRGHVAKPRAAQS